jgi:hypothetical protein
MQLANTADAGSPVNVVNPANVANGVLREVAVRPRRDAAVVVWAALFATDSLARAKGLTARRMGATLCL